MLHKRCLEKCRKNPSYALGLTVDRSEMQLKNILVYGLSLRLFVEEPLFFDSKFLKKVDSDWLQIFCACVRACVGV